MVASALAWWMGTWGTVALGQGAGGQGAGDLLTRIDNLDVVGSVLYVAAHPDDENTRLIHWLVQERGLRTAYLSMTRGGGGQNLIGAERAERLSVLRTGELLAARAIDGGQQLFARMRDFGYSKSPEETLRLWGRDEALDDVVRAIRTFRPDIVITRFAADGGGHGHHTASAQLAAAAFELAGDPNYVTPGLSVWQPQRLLRNESTWRRPKDEPIPESWLRVDVGTYDPRTGKSGGEVAARARSQHKSQGFGSAPRFGPQWEYFTRTAGAPLAVGSGPFGGIETSWDRFDGTGAVARAVAQVRRTFDPRAPEAVLPLLAKLHERLGDVEDPHWRAVKRLDVEALMRQCAGVRLVARSPVVAASPGQTVPLELMGLARRPADVEVRGITGPPFAKLAGWSTALGPEPVTREIDLVLHEDAPLSMPHWLRITPGSTRYTIADPAERTMADQPPAKITVELAIEGVVQRTSIAVAQATTDRVRGEVVRPFEVLPRVTATFDARGVLVPRGGAVEVPLTVAAPTLRADDAPFELSWTLEAPEGVTVTASPWPVTLAHETPEQRVMLHIEAQAASEVGEVTVTVDGRLAEQRHRIVYTHVPERTVLKPARLRITPVDLRRGAVSRVGYLPGSGDDVAEVLRTVGYAVTILERADLEAGNLRQFDVVVLGVRAYNTRPELVADTPALLDYVHDGGTVIVQYNTSQRWTTLSDAIGPASLKVGRGRVTDETAVVTRLVPEHRILTHPNLLDDSDFDGWVQERGLYFVESWDESYTPLFSMYDPDEEPQEGSTLVAHHGRGTWIYTGLSFFRQLPEGVPGAMRLFANLLAGER